MSGMRGSEGLGSDKRVLKNGNIFNIQSWKLQKPT